MSAMTKNQQKLQQELEENRGKWVVLSSDEKRILGAGETIDDAMKNVDTKTKPAPVLIKVPAESDATFYF